MTVFPRFAATVVYVQHGRHTLYGLPLRTPPLSADLGSIVIRALGHALTPPSVPR